MESNFEPRHDPASMLEELSTDRDRMGQRMTAETWWAAPAQGLGVALIAVAPAAGLAWAWVLFVLSLAVLIGVEVLFRKRSGLGINRPAGPRGVWLLIAVFAVIFVSVVLSMLLALFGLIGWVFAVAVVAGVATALLVVAYNRAYAAELHSAR